MLAAVGAILVLVIAGVGVWVSTHPDNSVPASRNGCVNVLLAGATGGELFHACGANARSWCAQEYRADNADAAISQAQCRLAGIKRAA
jgi:hypothetical protein